MGFKPRLRRIAVHWDDATVDYGWKEANDPFHSLPAIVTTGFLVRRDSQSIEVAQSVNDHDGVTEVMRIPMGCVTRIEYI